MSRILIIDDDSSIREMLEMFLAGEGYETDLAANGAEALAKIQTQDYDAAISDIKMPGMSGIELLEKAQKAKPNLQILMITAYTNAEDSVRAMRAGAYDYITKPFNLEEVKELLDKAVEKGKLLNENRELKREVKGRGNFLNIVGRSEAMQRVFSLIELVAGSKSTALITGESGTGKELVARAVHNMSPRSGAPFIPVNCVAIPNELIESELFGHLKGAFTSAVSEKQGLFKAANGGTIFLDEIGELPLDMQVKLLRVMEEQKVRPVGAVNSEPINVRIIAATNRDLKALSAKREFREDLYFRLNVINIHLPPLRHRRDDIPRLINAFMERACNELGKPPRTLSPDAMDKLMSYDFPGNVRELQNIIERALVLCPSGVVTPEYLPPLVSAPRDSAAILRPSPEEIRIAEEKARPRADSALRPKPEDKPSASDSVSFPKTYYTKDELLGGINLEETLDRMERYYLETALAVSNGNKTEAARILGLTFRSFRYRLSKTGLEKEEQQ